MSKKARIVVRRAIVVGTGLLAPVSLASAMAPVRSSGLVPPLPETLRDPLCREATDFDHAADSSRITGRVESGHYAAPAAPVWPLTVLAYNVERGVRLDDQLRAFASGTIPRPDVLLMSEADRGCTRSGGRNVAREYAQALGMDYVFAVEFLELPRWTGRGGYIETVCEHGNAILSRFPLSDVRVLRHAANWNPYSPPDSWKRRVGEPRLGGRATVSAAVQVGPTAVQAYSVHLDWAPWAGRYRDAQAAEVLADARSQAGPVVVGGDWNGHGYALDLAWGTHFDPVPPLFRSAGFDDAQWGLHPRPSTHWPMILDVPYGRGALGRRRRVRPGLRRPVGPPPGLGPPRASMT